MQCRLKQSVFNQLDVVRYFNWFFFKWMIIHNAESMIKWKTETDKTRTKTFDAISEIYAKIFFKIMFILQRPQEKTESRVMWLKFTTKCRKQFFQLDWRSRKKLQLTNQKLLDCKAVFNRRNSFNSENSSVCFFPLHCVLCHSVQNAIGVRPNLFLAVLRKDSYAWTTTKGHKFAKKIVTFPDFLIAFFLSPQLA